MNKRKVFWFAFGVLALMFAVIQFVPSPPVVGHSSDGKDRTGNAAAILQE